MTLIESQDKAVQSILYARTQGNRASMFGMTALNKSPRVLRGIRKTYEKELIRMGFNQTQLEALWQDVKDVAVLEAEAV